MRVFLSYSKDGAELARRLARDLSKHGIDVMTPDSVIQPGEPWAQGVADTIDSSDSVVSIIAGDSAEDESQSAEVALAAAGARRGKRVIPVLSSKKAQLPYFLRQFQNVDLSDPRFYEPNVGRLIEALKSPREPLQLTPEAMQSQEQVIEAQQQALLLAERSLQIEYQAKSAQLMILFAVLLTLLSSGTLVSLIIYGLSHRGHVGWAIALLLALTGVFSSGVAMKQLENAREALESAIKEARR
jgi:TIR domain